MRSHEMRYFRGEANRIAMGNNSNSYPSSVGPTIFSAPDKHSMTSFHFPRVTHSSNSDIPVVDKQGLLSIVICSYTSTAFLSTKAQIGSWSSWWTRRVVLLRRTANQPIQRCALCRLLAYIGFVLALHCRVWQLVSSTGMSNAQHGCSYSRKNR